MALSYSDKIETEFGSFIPQNWCAERIKFCVTYNDESLADTTDPDFEITYVDISSVHLIKGITNTEIMPFSKAPSRARRKVKHGDTIVSTVRTYLKAIAPIKDPVDNLVVSTGFAVLRPTEKVSSRYLSYFFQSQDFVDAVGANSVGVSYPAINPSSLVCIPCTYPKSNDEQTQIAKFLDYKTAQIDRLIEKKKVLIEKLNEQRIAMITQAVTKGLNPDAPMKDSEVDWLGEVPEHWEVQRLKFCSSYNDESLPDTTDPDFELNYVDISSVNHVDGITHFDAMTFDKAPSRARRIVKSGDVIVSTVRTYLKAIASIKKEVENLIVSTGFAVIRAREETISPRFLSYFVLSQGFIDTVVAYSKGVSYPAINASELVTISIAFPTNKNEQEKISDYIDSQISSIDRMISVNNKTIDKLNEYRTALITAAVTGKIDVREVNVPEGV
ncbi:restriction endonuclease subunit S [Methylophaga thalassica]|uniref:restriction endonuclease subunit S n=1 Tax=Methylophaga thalassica TaxID=40223 RepID=UPI002E7B3C91|nr:restriction endonuclease subunit S [Methylophaga thalassica]WVI84917.1 restriction endonuclease subunit S [Methylophaga thalassica]